MGKGAAKIGTACVWLLAAQAWLFPAQAQAIECSDLRRLEVPADVCQVTVGFDRERHVLAMRGAAARTSDPAGLESAAMARLDVALSGCDTLQCVRDGYLQEAQWLDAYVPPAAGVAASQPEGAVADAGMVSFADQARVTEGAVDAWGRDAVPASSVPSVNPLRDPSTASFAAPVDVAPTEQVAIEDDGSTTRVSSERPRLEAWQEQLLVLSFWGLLGATVLLLILGTTNRVVIFYDGADAWWSIAPFLALVIGYMVVRSLAPSAEAGFASTLVEKVVVVVTILVAALAVLVNYRNAIHHNRSMVLGIIVGTLKLMIAVFMAATVIGQFNRIMDSGSTRRQVSGALLILALVGVLWRVLLNGKRVYERRGWLVEPRV